RVRSSGRVLYVSPRLTSRNAYSATSKNGINDITLVMLSISVKASRDQYVLMTKSWTTMLVSHSAAAGTLFAFSVENTLGMSPALPALKSTSAQISDQARYAPSTETSSPMLMNTAPQCPTTVSSTPAIDGCRMSAICARFSTAYGSRVTSTIREV